MKKQKNKNLKLWGILSIVFIVLLVIMIVANVLGSMFQTTIDLFLNTTHNQVTGDTTGGKIYYPSEFAKKDADGNSVISDSSSDRGKEEIDGVALSEAGNDLVEEVAKEGFVLLSNDGALPLEKGSTVSVFGQSVDNPVTSGTGSGDASGSSSFAATYATSLQAGGLTLNQSSYDFYSTGAGAKYKLEVPGMHDANPFRINECPWSEVRGDSTFAQMTDCDTALVVFSRNGGEGYDLSNGVSDVGYDFGFINVADGLTKEEGSLTGNNYLELNGTERGVLAGLKELKDNGTIENIIVVLNSANAIELDFLNKDICGVDYGIDACVWIGATGQSGLNALGPILSGDVTPSGHLVDTYCYDNLREPSIYNFGHNEYTNYQSDYRSQTDALASGAWMGERYYNVYAEGIYVGYRYYETRYADYVLGTTTDTGNFNYEDIVAYSFGHGMSYADFVYTGFEVAENEDSFDFSVTVKNESADVSGKEVVQIYVQTPYTDYDRQNHIEESAIELVGYKKTQLLAPGTSETVKITVPKELLTSYDANNAHTYIMDEGDYNFTFGNGAHDALNRILAKTADSVPTADESRIIPAPSPAVSSCVNDVYTWTVEERDTTTYSASSSTGEEITNQFDNVDLNKYENGKQAITYVSRNDWKGTFDTTSMETMAKISVTLQMTDQMYSEIKFNQYTPPAEAASATMPQMGVTNKDRLKLIQFVGVPLDGSIEYNGSTYTWDDLLNQVTYNEMVELIIDGQHQTARVGSVSKPATRDENGPSGFNSNFLGGGSGTAYPAPCVRAATWNDELVKRVGELIGEDGLASRYNGLLGPAANIHRNAYCGRNFEYYSEDALLSSQISTNEVQGIQSKGIIVYMKHFALNDSETHREGVGTWANEQSIREIYLEAFRGSCKKDGGNAHAIMSAFNRFGTIWSGNSNELMNNVLRGEWGFDGFIATDADVCDTTTHCTAFMYAPRAVTSGTDIFDGVGNPLDHNRENELKAYRDDPYVVSCMRQATQRILYAVANSAAMNGMTINTDVGEILPWWHALAIALLVIFAVFAVASVVMFILNWKKVIAFPHKLKVAEGEKDAAAGNVVESDASGGADEHSANDKQ